MKENLVSELSVVLDTWTAPHPADYLRLKRIVESAEAVLQSKESAPPAPNSDYAAALRVLDDYERKDKLSRIFSLTEIRQYLAQRLNARPGHSA